MNALDKAYDMSRALVTTAHARAMQIKQAGMADLLTDTSSVMGGIFGGKGSAANRERYSLFRGWVYSAINALASEGAGQDVHVGRLLGAKPKESQRIFLVRKHTATEFEIIEDHPLLDALEEPNPIQGQWQFVYNFIANLMITGWSYIIGGETEEGLQFYSLPTTWVRPVHKEGPFSHFRIINPNKPDQQFNDDDLLDRTQVAFAHLPNPSDPLAALSPMASQITAIRVDDHIQTSQSAFFQNGVFPSVVISIGRDPHPDVPGGVRPRLTGDQRRQVQAAIQRTMTGVQNYGHPAIVDGLIEKIERLSATSTEMGWERSENTIRTRILSAFGVHPYILGEPVNVGGYAQAAKIEERFCKRVNTVLDMLGRVMTNFAGPMSDDRNRIIVWWDECQPHDPALYWQNLRDARKNGDITRNELRSELGLPPDETGGDRTRQFSSADVQQLVAVQKAVQMGEVSPEQAVSVLMVAFDMSEKDAESIVGDAPPPAPVVETPPVSIPAMDDEDDTDEVEDALEQAVNYLGISPKVIADHVEAVSREYGS